MRASDQRNEIGGSLLGVAEKNGSPRAKLSLVEACSDVSATAGSRRADCSTLPISPMSRIGIETPCGLVARSLYPLSQSAPSPNRSRPLHQLLLPVGRHDRVLAAVSGRVRAVARGIGTNTSDLPTSEPKAAVGVSIRDARTSRRRTDTESSARGELRAFPITNTTWPETMIS